MSFLSNLFTEKYKTNKRKITILSEGGQPDTFTTTLSYDGDYFLFKISFFSFYVLS